MDSQKKSALAVAATKSADQNDQEESYPEFSQAQQDYMDEGFDFAHDCNR